MIDEPLISIIMPVFNGEKYLHKAIKSILSQTLDDFEFLIINDGSTDNTRNIIESYKDERIRLIDNEINLGLASSLNRGISLSRGVYIARMDADDVSFPERFKRQVEHLQAHPEIDLLGCRAVVFRNLGDIVGLLPFFPSHQAICARPWRGISLPHPTWIGRANWFRHYQYRFPEVLRAEDQELLLRAYPDSCFACLDEVLLGYRQGSFNLAKTLLARRTLLKAQIRLFVRRHQWGNFFLAIIASCFKLGVDLIAAMPACNRAFFWRMAEPVPISAMDKLKRILGNFNGSK
jgi:glycosyltransferase involved in cell wall biosynthesis